MPRTQHDDHFRTIVHRRLEPGETIVATARVWTARPSRAPLLAARFRDEAVVTDRRLMVWQCGWWTRRPRRRVVADRLDTLTVSNATSSGSADTGGAAPVRRVRLDHADHRPVVLEIGRDDESQRFAAALLAAATARPTDSTNEIGART
jgi:hypothetical protein